MDYFKSIPFKSQNEIEPNILHCIRDYYYIKKSGEAFSFFIKNGVHQKDIENYITSYYIYPRASAIAIFNGNVWKRYIYNEENQQFVLEYESNYFILSFKNNLLIRHIDNIYTVCKYKKTDAELIIDKVLLSFTNFVIDEKDKKIYFINDITNRKLTYEIDTDVYEDRIVKSGNNVLKCKKSSIYFDNVGGLEIYNKKNVRQFYTNRYYKLEYYLYVIKSNDEYILMDFYNDVVLFRGLVLHIINNEGWIIDKRKNEIAVISTNDIEIMPFDKYVSGDKTPFKKHSRKIYKNKGTK